MNLEPLFWGLAIIIGLLFLMALPGVMSEPRHTAGRPPEDPPGRKTRQRK